MVGHGESSSGSYLADPTSPIPSDCASIDATSTLRVNRQYPVNEQKLGQMAKPRASNISYVVRVIIRSDHLSIIIHADIIPCNN